MTDSEPALVEMPARRPARVARVAVDVSLPHLDSLFDYAITEEQAAAAVVGARVRVRFAGRLRDGFIVERASQTAHQGRLATLHAVVSSEPVLTPVIARLLRRVADHYAGTFADMVRLAVPPRHAATEKAATAKITVAETQPANDQQAASEKQPTQSASQQPPSAAVGPNRATVLGGYPGGRALLESLGRGEQTHGYWQVTAGACPAGDWASGFAEAAAATLAAGRGSVLIVPDQRDLHRLARACHELLGPDRFARLTADLGPAARYREFLRISRGMVQVVIGTRAAAYAPVNDLGLVALWDDGDDLLAEPRAPYPHTREVLSMRAGIDRSALLFAGYSRSAEVAALIENGWLAAMAHERSDVRQLAPVVRIAADRDQALARDPAARSARLPREAFELIRARLPQGPVLVQVPRAGYRLALACEQCREPLRCAECAGPLVARPGERLDCGWCGRLVPRWRCGDCADTRWRAPVIGAMRLAEEIGRAFPQTKVIRSTGSAVVPGVFDEPALVVATPGAEPQPSAGYAAAILVDAVALLARPDLRAGEEAVRRWLNAVALVRPAPDGGTVLVVGPSDSRALQALVRLDPAGFARREVAERGEAHLPPAARLATIDGSPQALAQVLAPIRDELPAGAEVLGPVLLDPAVLGSAGRVGSDRLGSGQLGSGAERTPLHRLTIRVPPRGGAQLSRLLQQAQAIRSAKKEPGATRVRIDPVEMD